MGTGRWDAVSRFKQQKASSTVQHEREKVDARGHVGEGRRASARLRLARRD